MDIIQLKADILQSYRSWKYEKLDTGYRVSKLNDKDEVEYFYDRISKKFFNCLQYKVVKDNNVIDVGLIDRIKLYFDVTSLLGELKRRARFDAMSTPPKRKEFLNQRINNNGPSPRQQANFDRTYNVDMSEDGTISIQAKGNISINNDKIFVDGQEVTPPKASAHGWKGLTVNNIPSYNPHIDDRIKKEMSERAQRLKSGQLNSKTAKIREDIDAEAEKIRAMLKRIKNDRKNG